MRPSMLFAIIVLALIAVAPKLVVAQTSVASPADTMRTIAEIVRRSPYKGSFMGPDGIQVSGNELSFWLENGRLEGKYISNSRQARTGENPSGPVRWLEVKGDRITFESQSKASYNLTLTKDGKITGTSQGVRGTATGRHVFEPTQE